MVMYKFVNKSKRSNAEKNHRTHKQLIEFQIVVVY